MRQKNDNYPTPVHEARRILNRLHAQGFLHKGWKVLDPSCGAGALCDALIAEGFDRSNLRGIEIDHELAAQNAFVKPLVGDALEMKWPDVDMVFMNPPYSHAFDFVKMAVERSNLVLALLRLSFMGSLSRSEFHRKHTSSVYVIPRRIKFVGNGSDTTDSAWFFFRNHPVSTWEVLP